jgi:hypothetical protein
MEDDIITKLQLLGIVIKPGQAVDPEVGPVRV